MPPPRVVLGALLDAQQHLAGHQQDHRTYQLTTDAGRDVGRTRRLRCALRYNSRQQLAETGTTINAQVESAQPNLGDED